MNARFWVAAFGPDGELFGKAERSTDTLAPKWLEASRLFLVAHGWSFARTSWGHELNEFETRLTTASACGLATFYVKGSLASSHLLLTGRDPTVEADLLNQFVLSVGRGSPAPSSDSFESLRRVPERPLELVVLWNPAVAESALEAANQLAQHFVGALFLGWQADIH